MNIRGNNIKSSSGLNIPAATKLKSIKINEPIARPEYVNNLFRPKREKYSNKQKMLIIRNRDMQVSGLHTTEKDMIPTNPIPVKSLCQKLFSVIFFCYNGF